MTLLIFSTDLSYLEAGGYGCLHKIKNPSSVLFSHDTGRIFIQGI